MPAVSVASVQNTWIAPNLTRYPIYSANHPSMLHNILPPYPVAVPSYPNTWPSASPSSLNTVSFHTESVNSLYLCLSILPNSFS